LKFGQTPRAKKQILSLLGFTRSCLSVHWNSVL